MKNLGIRQIGRKLKTKTLSKMERKKYRDGKRIEWIEIGIGNE